MYIHEQRYKKIKFLHNQTKSFITWICPLLQPQEFNAKQFIYLEGDDVSQIFFLAKGRCNFVMPSFDNTSYIKINVGDSFGIIDIVGSSATKEFDLELFVENQNKLQRQFTVMSMVENCEILSLSI